MTDEFEKQPAVTGRVGTVRCEFCLPRHEIRLGSADVADLKRIHNFWAKLVFCCMELLKYCRNVANVKALWYGEVVPKNSPTSKAQASAHCAWNIVSEPTQIEKSHKMVWLVWCRNLPENIKEPLNKSRLTGLAHDAPPIAHHPR